MTPEPSPWLTVQEAAPLLGIGPKNVYVLASRGKIAHYRIGPNKGKIRFRRSDIDEYLEGCRVGDRPAARLAPPAPRLYVPKRDISKAGSPPFRR